MSNYTRRFEVQSRSKMDFMAGTLQKHYDLKDRPYWEIYCNSLAGGNLFDRLFMKNAKTKRDLLRKIRREVKRTKAKIRWVA
jgi:hypothetical protein